MGCPQAQVKSVDSQLPWMAGECQESSVETRFSCQIDDVDMESSRWLDGTVFLLRTYSMSPEDEEASLRADTAVYQAFKGTSALAAMKLRRR